MYTMYEKKKQVFQELPVNIGLAFLVLAYDEDIVYTPWDHNTRI